MEQKAFKGLDQLNGGAVSERFNAELKEVWENVYDMRTSAVKARSITLTVTIKPNANRDGSQILYDVKKKLCPAEPLQQMVFMRQRDDGSVQITEQTTQTPGQMDMDGYEAPFPNVVEFKPIKAAESK